MDNNIITIIHFNDVYNITPYDRDPVGGAARFVTAIKQRSHLNPLVLFSGDAFSPSIMSTFTKGKQMVPCLNACNIQCSVVGNHDFDFGVDNFEILAKENNFPWLMSNVYDNFTSEPLGNGKVSHTIEWQGRKIGLIGLVEEDWVVTLSTVDPNDITVTDFVDEGTTIASELKASGVDYIIALTHMRWPNDERLAASVDEIDLVLGGHDHNDGHLIVNGKHVIKSGSDFREFAVITLDFTPGRSDIVSSVEFVNVTKDIPEDEEIKAVVDSYNSVISEKMEVPLGELNVELDGRFSSVRTQETNLGNLMCDIMLRALDCDIALLNSGTLRSDVIHPAGVFKMKDMMNILPMMDNLVVMEVTADQLLEALENGVSKYPALEGRFPQVSGVEFAYRSSKPGGQRIDRDSVLVGGAPLDEDRKYKLCTKSYLAEGKDGYDVFKKCPVLVDEENSPTMHTIIQNHFTTVKVLQGFKKCLSSHMTASLIRRSSVQLPMINIVADSGNDSHEEEEEDAIHPHHNLSAISENEDAEVEESPMKLSPMSAFHHAGGGGLLSVKGGAGGGDKWSMLKNRRSSAMVASSRRRSSVARHDMQMTVQATHVSSSLAPKVEGRIKRLD